VKKILKISFIRATDIRGGRGASSDGLFRGQASRTL
jgi:hypothetical protein